MVRKKIVIKMVKHKFFGVFACMVYFSKNNIFFQLDLGRCKFWINENIRKHINGLFNVGTGQARTWNDYVKAIFAAMSIETQIDYVDMPDSIRDQYQYYTEANMDKLRSVGYEKPSVSLEEAVKDYVQNYLSQGEFLSGQS